MTLYRIYQLFYRSPETGEKVKEHFTNKKHATARARELEAGGAYTGLLQYDVPNRKQALVHWLNSYMSD